MSEKEQIDGVARLLAEAEIARFVVRYAALNDTSDFAALAALFTEHGVLVRPSDGQSITGRAAILDSFFARPPRHSRHLSSNILVDFAGSNAASVRSNMLLYTAPSGPLPAVAASPALHGGFEDRLVRTVKG
ncbi:nuclear transport factor 2 family protein [Sphingomonas sp. UYEF23]|uniref:nuclear transport factor 2 family protein n=1 Tax=Sphingomonas sp. UYEF23 TaxID=1756408 RepID=UPI00339A3F45